MKPKKQMKRESVMMDGKAVPESSVFLDVLLHSSKTRRAEIKPSKERGQPRGLAGPIAVGEAQSDAELQVSQPQWETLVLVPQPTPGLPTSDRITACRGCARGGLPRVKFRRVTITACPAQVLLCVLCCALWCPGPISAEQKSPNIWRILLEGFQRDRTEHTIKVITAVCFVNCC